MDNLDQRRTTIAHPERKPLPTVFDPKLYLSNFYNSQEFKESYDNFFEGKNINPNVTDEQKMKSFLDYGEVEHALYDFYLGKMKIGYDGNYYTPEISKKWQDYTTTIRKIKANRYDNKDYFGHDALRSRLHGDMADTLVLEELAPNRKVGKKLIQLMTITCGLEDIGFGEMSEAERRMYQITGKVNRVA